MRPSTECCLERRDMCARSAQGFVKNSGKTIQPWPRRMRRSRSTGTRLSVSSVSCWVVSISAGRRWRRIAPVAWGWKVTGRSLVDRPPHCGRGRSTPAVPTRTQVTAAVLRNSWRCGASRPAPGDGQGAEGLESDEARGISGAHAQAMPIGVGCHKGVAELEDGRLQKHRNAQRLPLCV